MKKRILSLAVTFAMLLTLLPAIGIAALAAPATYDAGDIAVVNSIIDNNGLSWPKYTDGTYTAAPPAVWDIVWDDTTGRIGAISLDNEGLTGTLDVSGLTEMTSLECRNNLLTAIDVSGCTVLWALSCENNLLVTLDLSNNTILELLSCPNNKLTALDVTKNTLLWHIFCSDNQLTALDLSKTPALEWFACSGNQLTALDVSNKSSLTAVHCNDNQIKTLNVSNCPTLDTLHCKFNQLETLDVSANNSLKELYCNNNKLKSIKLSAAAPYEYIDVTCNELLETAITGRNITWDGDFFRFYPQNIPHNAGDVAVVNSIIDNNGLSWSKYNDPSYQTAPTDWNVNWSADGRITELSIGYQGLTGKLDVSGLTALEYLECCENELTAIDVSGNIKLWELDCADNQLTSLDVRHLSELKGLFFSWNNITSIDVSNNLKLTNLGSGDNPLTSLDVSNNTELVWLACWSNELTTLDVSKNLKLDNLQCSDNSLTELYVKNNTELTELNCPRNELLSLDVSNNNKLEVLLCSCNQLKTLDVSGCPYLEELYCDNNELVSIQLHPTASYKNITVRYNELIKSAVTGQTIQWDDDWVTFKYEYHPQRVPQEGNVQNEVTIYYYNTEGWNTVGVYAWEPFEMWGGWHGGLCTDIGNGWWSAVVPYYVDDNHIIFNNANGSNSTEDQTWDLLMKSGTNYFYGNKLTGPEDQEYGITSEEAFAKFGSLPNQSGGTSPPPAPPPSTNTPSPEPVTSPEPTPAPEPITTIPGSGGTSPDGEGNEIAVAVTVDASTGGVTLKLDKDTTAALIDDALARIEAAKAAAQALIDEAIANGEEPPEIDIPLPTVTLDLSGIEGAARAVLDVDTLAMFNNAEVAVKIVLPDAEITMSPDTLAALIEAAAEAGLAGNAPVSVEAVDVQIKELKGKQAAQAKSYETVINIDVLIGGKKVDVSITVSLPYKLKPNENPAAVRVWYMDDDGNLTNQNGVYDAETGMITFTISHQSYYVVGYDPVALWVNIFSDLTNDDPFYEAIAFMNMRSLYHGFDDGTVGTHGVFTRAQLVYLLWNLEGNPACSDADSSRFDDVSEGAWYFGAVQWAAENDVVGGVGGGLFAPDSTATRQEVTQILYNYAINFKGYVIPNIRESIADYADQNDISGWAEDAVKELYRAGVLKNSETLRPADEALRGEIAELFKDFLWFVPENQVDEESEDGAEGDAEAETETETEAASGEAQD